MQLLGSIAQQPPLTACLLEPAALLGTGGCGARSLSPPHSTDPTQPAAAHLESVDVSGHVPRQLCAHEGDVQGVGPLPQQEPAAADGFARRCAWGLLIASTKHQHSGPRRPHSCKTLQPAACQHQNLSTPAARTPRPFQPHLCFTCGCAHCTDLSVTRWGGNSAFTSLIRLTDVSVLWSTICGSRGVPRSRGRPP